MRQANTNTRINNSAQVLQERINAQFYPPRLGQDLISHLLREEYGLIGRVHHLSGEREQNFLLQQDDEDRYVVKIFRHDDAPGMIEIQTRALQNIKAGLPQIPVPAVRKTLSGEAIFRYEAAGEGALEIRVLEYLEGYPVEAGATPSPVLAEDAGKLVGTVTRRLGQLRHGRIEAFMPWDVSNRLLGDPSFWSLGGADMGRYESRLRQAYTDILPALLRQRTHLIYNDAHLGNLLRLSDDAGDVSGLIDFGDMVHAPIICDVAILALGFAENAADPATLAAAAVSGYHSAYPLLSREVDMICDLMIARQALSILLFDIKLNEPRLFSDGLVKARAGLMDGLDRLLDIDKAQFTSVIRDACGLRG